MHLPVNPKPVPPPAVPGICVLPNVGLVVNPNEGRPENN